MMRYDSQENATICCQVAGGTEPSARLTVNRSRLIHAMSKRQATVSTRTPDLAANKAYVTCSGQIKNFFVSMV